MRFFQYRIFLTAVLLCMPFLLGAGGSTAGADASQTIPIPGNVLVAVVVLAVWLGIGAYLFRIDLKIAKLEKKITRGK